MSKRIDAEQRVGEKHNRLTIVAVGPPAKHRRCTVECECEPGKTFEADLGNVTSGKSRSCGCFVTEMLVERNTTHGMSGRPEYVVWCGLVQRCTDPGVECYADYGGRGITICERWKGEEGFANFFADKGERPSPRHQIDRYPDKNGPYSPENTRWATSRENNNNRRDNRLIDVFGETKTVSEWSRDPRCKVGMKVLHARLLRGGWEAEAAITKPPRPTGREVKRGLPA